MNHSVKDNRAGKLMATGSADTLGQRRMKSAIHGGMLGVWWALSIIAASWGERLLWRIAAAHVTQPPIVGTEAISRASAHFGLSQFALVAMGIFVFAAIGAATGWALAMLGQRLRLDPQQSSRRALLDALGQWRSILLWAMPVLLVFLIVLFVDSGDRSAPARLALFGSVVVLVLLSPFLVFNRAILAEPSASRIWIPRWPGWCVVAAGSLIVVAEIFIGFSLDIFSMATSPVFRIITEPTSWVVGAFASAMLCATWIDREGFRGFRYPWLNGHPWRVAGPFLALTIRLGIVMMWLAPLLLVPWFLALYIAPSAASVLEDHGETLPHALSWIRIWAEDGLLALCALGTLITFATGRTHVLASSPMSTEPGRCAGH
jgi:hypothetical protein